MTRTLTSDAAWCRRVFDSLVDGGIWGVPRSGLVFTRKGETLVLTDRMPWMEGMPIDQEQVLRQQDSDYAVIKLHMAEAGITVTDDTMEEE